MSDLESLVNSSGKVKEWTRVMKCNPDGTCVDTGKRTPVFYSKKDQCLYKCTLDPRWKECPGACEYDDCYRQWMNNGGTFNCDFVGNRGVHRGEMF